MTIAAVMFSVGLFQPVSNITILTVKRTGQLAPTRKGTVRSIEQPLLGFYETMGSYGQRAKDVCGTLLLN